MRADTAARDCALLYANAWMPANLGAKLVADLNADIGVTVSGGRVTSWADQSAYGNTPTQITFGNQGTRVLAALDGHAGIHTSGGQWYVKSGFTGIAAGDLPTAYCVASFDSASANFSGTPFSLAVSTTNDSGIKIAHLSTTLYMTAKRTTGAASDGPNIAPGINGVPVLFQARLDAAASVHVVNGVDVYSRAASGGLVSAMDSLKIATAEGLGSIPLTGTVYRLLIVNPAPSAAEHAAIMRYLKQQYPSLGLP